MTGQQSLFTFLTVGDTRPIDPYYRHNNRINNDKKMALDKHKKSEEGKRQLWRVFNIYLDNPKGLTDREISDVYEITFGIRCNPSTVSARRNDIINGDIPGYTVEPVIADGKPLKRGGGQVNKLLQK